VAEGRLEISLPAPVRRLLLDSDGRFDVEDQWWVAWPLDRIVQDNLAAWSQRGLPRSLVAIVDDGTVDPFCLDLTAADDRVVRWSWNESAVAEDERSWEQYSRAWLSAP
jgi:hypothetical protein